MPRPHLYSFIAIQTDKELCLRANVNFVSKGQQLDIIRDKVELSAPLKSIGLIKAREARIKITAKDKQGQMIFTKEYDSDAFGGFDLKIPTTKKIDHLHIYETSSQEGLELVLGSYLPLHLNPQSKLIVSDFDKTLVDTKFSTLKEVISSLKNPVSSFPNISESLGLFKDYIQKGYAPFILSASPHFYERSIRDWSYQNGLYGPHILLKDYRTILSLTQGILSPKDVKRQGFYKLNQLVDLLLMTGIPEELVLMGDAFESDPFIYMTLLSVIADRYDPWKLWSEIKGTRPFSFTSKQDSQFLTKFYQLSEMARKRPLASFKVFIRYNKAKKVSLDDFHFPTESMRKLSQSIEFYQA